jgi:hypothetical protein
MRWLFAKLRWMWTEPLPPAKGRVGGETWHGEMSLAWNFRLDVTSLDQWMDLNA